MQFWDDVPVVQKHGTCLWYMTISCVQKASASNQISVTSMACYIPTIFQQMVSFGLQKVLLFYTFPIHPVSFLNLKYRTVHVLCDCIGSFLKKVDPPVVQFQQDEYYSRTIFSPSVTLVKQTFTTVPFTLLTNMKKYYDSNTNQRHLFNQSGDSRKVTCG